jgi:class 3 adenylate cyclase/tetratricopeptide (TPR) repeat protein
VRVCSRCGEENPDRFRLCGFCGHEFESEIPVQEIRKTVTVVFCDLKGSTSLAESIDTESLRSVLTRYFGEMRRVLERHGGTVEKYIGDAVMAVFGLPRAHEDDALRAVRAAADMQTTLAELNDELERQWGVRLANRTGVNTGEVVAGDLTGGQRLVTGDTVNVAARLEQAAPEMQVLMGESTYRLVRDAVDVEVLEPLELKGKAERVRAYLLLGVRGAQGYARRQDAPMVGRTAELESLAGAFREARDRRTCRLITVIGPAGAGKSRLVAEFLRSVSAEAHVLIGHCLSYGEGITFWPLAEVVREAAGIAEEDAALTALGKIAAILDGSRLDSTEREDVANRVAAVMGLSPGTYQIDETFWGARKFLEAMASARPLVVLFDDIHWAEPTFLDLCEHVADSSHGAPILLVCTARHELLEERPAWADGNTVISLGALSDAESTQVADNLLGTSRLPEDARARIVRAAQGNPLFVEQMLSMLIDDGSLRQEDHGEWALAVLPESISVPPTIAALLAARLDRLSTEERVVVERGSVMGEVFYRRAVEALVPEPHRDRVGPGLSTLSRKQLVVPEESALVGLADEDAFRFVHILIRDSAYQGLLKKTRAELHEGFADWMGSAAGSRLLEYEEIVGYHLEQAHRYLLELGPGDERVRDIGARGSARLAAAGRRALARGDSRAAVNLLGRAVSMLPNEDRTRLELLPDLGQALMDAGELAAAEAELEEAILRAQEAEDTRVEAVARVARLMVRFITSPAAWAQLAMTELSPIIHVLEDAGDHAGLAKAWALLGYVHGTASRFAAAELAVGRALEHARLAGDRREEARNLSAYAQSALYGPMPVPLAIVRCEELLKEAEGDRRAEALILCALSRLRALGGEPELARELYRRARSLNEDLGGKLHAALVSIDSGPAEMLAGDLTAAEAELRRDYEVLEAMGERVYLSTTAAWLAHVEYGQGRLEEAERYSRIAEEAASPDDTETQALWRSARGKTLASEGRVEEGEALLREAVAMIERTEQPDAQGMMLLDLARVLVMGNRTTEALPVIRSAKKLFDQKGNVVSSSAAAELLADVDARVT